MPDFTILPTEILIYILSYVNQVDCIECMTVCRRWYKLFSQHGKDLWKKLEISETSCPRFNNAMLECLGTHVENVSVIFSENLDKILQQLKHKECNIQSLEIRATSRAYPFDLDRATLFNGIGLFADTLKELFLDGHVTQHLSCIILLDLLPSLTHLTIKFNYRFSPMRPVDQKPISEEIRRNKKAKNDDNYNLIFLSLDSEFRCDFRLKEIVKRCPQLEYLLVSDSHTYEYPSKSPIEIAHLLKLCPSISYIHWGGDTVSHKIETEWLTLSRERDPDIKYKSSIHGKRETSSLRQVEFFSNDEERHISTLTECLQEPSFLEHLRLSGPFNIDLCQIWNRFAQRNSSLLLHPSKLESLELDGFYIPKQTENNNISHDIFIYFQNIERLKIQFFIRPIVDQLEEQQKDMRQLIESIGHQLHHLRCLHLDFACYNKRFSKISLCNNLTTTLRNWNQKLEILHLRNVFISNAMLLALCDHPNLHTLNLCGYQLDQQFTMDGWILFARKLKEQEQIDSRGFRSISLSCGYCDDVTDGVLEEFAGIKSLETLRIACNNNITDAGVNKFASIASSIGKKHNRIELYFCNNVSLENPHVVFVCFPY